LKYIPAKCKKLFNIAYLDNTWNYGRQKVFRAERLYTAQNYQSFLESFRHNFPSHVYFCPYMGKEVITAPLNSVKDIYVPKECLHRLAKLQTRDSLQNAALDLIKLLSTESQIDTEDFGIHGSIALNMHTPKSDVDLVVYGAQNFRKLEATIKKLVEAGTLTYMSKNRIDAARQCKGKYQGKTFMYNAVRKPEEVNSKYGIAKYHPTAPVRFCCTVKDDSEAMFRPAIYKIENYVPADRESTFSENKVPNQVVSMIGCYRNVARRADRIRVSGMLERVENVETGQVSHQVVVGTGTSEEEHIWPL
jgi:predicted nucleotidyltransferase